MATTTKVFDPVDNPHMTSARAWLRERGITPPPHRPRPITTLAPPRKKSRKGGPAATIEVTCFCGAPAELRPNSTKYGKNFGNGFAWLCSRWPECPGYVGTHPDGRPLGSLADPRTHRKRSDVHNVVDPLWRDGTSSRGQVYSWLTSISGRPIHIGELSLEECDDLLTLIRRHPFVVK